MLSNPGFMPLLPTENPHMPYETNDQLPAAARNNYKGHCLDVFRNVFNSSYKRNKNEALAMRDAHVAAMNCMHAGKQ